ncbi:MAG: hypothetical protein AAFQ53_11605, partial [Bacteroidota bacterium]
MDYNIAQEATRPEDCTYSFGTTDWQNWLSCKRRWFIPEVLGKREELTPRKRAALSYGSVLHLCVERYLLCPSGVVPPPVDVPDQPFSGSSYSVGSALYHQIPGQRVEIFPAGYEKFQERDGSWQQVGKPEALRIKDAVTWAIENSVLQHIPKGEVE